MAHVKGSAAWAKRNSALVSEIFNAVDFWILTVRPEIDAYLLRVIKRLRAETCRDDRNWRISSANKHSLC